MTVLKDRVHFEHFIDRLTPEDKEDLFFSWFFRWIDWRKHNGLDYPEPDTFFLPQAQREKLIGEMQYDEDPRLDYAFPFFDVWLLDELNRKSIYLYYGSNVRRRRLEKAAQYLPSTQNQPNELQQGRLPQSAHDGAGK